MGILSQRGIGAFADELGIEGDGAQGVVGVQIIGVGRTFEYTGAQLATLLRQQGAQGYLIVEEGFVIVTGNPKRLCLVQSLLRALFAREQPEGAQQGKQPQNSPLKRA